MLLLAGNDGYWLYSFNDISATNPNPPALHGSATDYWTAVDSVNQ